MTKDNIIQRTCFMWWIPKATDTQLERIFRSKDDYATASRHYVNTCVRIAFLVQFFFGT